MLKNVVIKIFFKYKIFVYDWVEINIGNGYDIKFGKFIVLESGIYVFYISIVVYDKFYSIIEVVKNGEVKDVMFFDVMDYNDWVVVLLMIILSLMKGEIVFVRVGLVYGGNKLESN